MNAEALASGGSIGRNDTYTTKCDSTTPDLRDWSCVTLWESPGAAPCPISTEVTTQGANLVWTAPNDFNAAGDGVAGCG